MTFEWCEKKNYKNYIKHSVWFEEAKTVWADFNSIEFFDPEHSHKEDRFIRVGFSTKNRLLLVVFCEQKQNLIRIISARKVSSEERRQYEEGI